jgi:hypothetical protein
MRVPQIGKKIEPKLCTRTYFSSVGRHRTISCRRREGVDGPHKGACRRPESEGRTLRQERAQRHQVPYLSRQRDGDLGVLLARYFAWCGASFPTKAQEEALYTKSSPGRSPTPVPSPAPFMTHAGIRDPARTGLLNSMDVDSGIVSLLTGESMYFFVYLFFHLRKLSIFLFRKIC